MIYYLQSCSYTAYNERRNEKIRDYLASKGVFICGCCHYCGQLFKEGDTVLYICDSCVAVTEEVSPQVKTESLYSWLLKQPDFPWPDFGGKEMSVQDSWGFNIRPELQHNVRECMKKMNIVPVEIEDNFEKNNYDGAGRYKMPSARKMKMAPKFFGEKGKKILPVPDEGIEETMKKFASRHTTDEVMTYSIGGKKGMITGGKEAYHILDLIVENLD